MRTVYLHVGQPKTGTSYVQSVLVNGADALKDHGILYPMPDSAEHGMNYGVNSGNFRTDQIMRRLDKLMTTHAQSDFLFSSEFMYREEFYDRALFPFLRERGVNIKVLMYIRNPMSQFLSVYQQAMKRTGFTGTVDEFVHAPGFDWRDFARAEDYVTHCEAHDVDLTVHNYSQRRETLIDDVLGWLGLPKGAIQAPEIVVNRGLSFAEVEVMRVLRRVFGEKLAFRTSDKLINSARDVKSTQIYPRPDLFQALLQEFLSVTQRFDDRYGDRYCRYDFDPEAEMQACTYDQQPQQLSKEYLDLLTEILGRNAYIDGMTTAELSKAFFARLKDRLAGRKRK